MVVTIQQVLRPLLIMCFIMGLGAYPIKQPNSRIRWITYLSILYSLMIWFSYAYLLYYITNLFTWKVLYHNVVTVIMLAMNIFTSITSAIINFYHQKVQLHFLSPIFIFI